jgi:hypothetical protein
MLESDKTITRSMCRTQVTKVPMKLWYKRTGKQSGQNLEEFSIETSIEEASLEVHSLESLRSFVL